MRKSYSKPTLEKSPWGLQKVTAMMVTTGPPELLPIDPDPDPVPDPDS